MFSWTVLLLFCALQLVFANEESAENEATTAAPEEEGSKVWPWVLAGVIVVLIIIGIVFFVLWKKKLIQKWFCKKKEDKDIRQAAPMYGKTATKTATQIKKNTTGSTTKGSTTKGSTTRSTVASGSSSKTGTKKTKTAKGHKKQKKMVGKKESGSTTNTTETPKESSTLEKATETATPVNDEQVERVDAPKKTEVEEVIMGVGGRWTVVNEIGSDFSFDISSVDSV